MEGFRSPNHKDEIIDAEYDDPRLLPAPEELKQEEISKKEKKDAYDSFVKGLDWSILATRKGEDSEKQKKEAYDSYVNGLHDSIRSRETDEETKNIAEPHKVGPSVMPEPEIIKDIGEPEEIIPSEDTPAESRAKLKGLVGKFYEGAKERVSGFFEKKKEYLASRNAELDVEAKKLGVEEMFRNLGEKYNKLGWKSKLAVGLGLGVGMGVSATGSSVLAGLGLVGFGTVIVAQRAAGLASMFLKYEKSTAEGKWQKEKAMGKAIAYTAGMTGAMMLLTEGVKEGTDWLKAHWPSDHGHGARFVPKMPTGSHGGSARVPTVHPETVSAPVNAPEMHAIASVEAKAGHGYEYMVKRMWEQINEHRDQMPPPSKIPADSDLFKLYYADPKDIDAVVHQIASDPKHEFFVGGESVQINPTDHISLGTDGQIHLGDTVHSPEGAHMTPAYNPEAVAEVPVTPVVEAPSHSAGITQPVEPFTPATEAAVPVTPAETPTPQAEHPLTTAEQTPVTYVENPAGLHVEIYKPHIYAGAGGKELFVYGGSPDDQAKAVGSYLTEHPKDAIFGTSSDGLTRIKYSIGSDGQFATTVAEKESFWARLFSGDRFMKPAGPEEFEKLTK